jgi:hypothetical protein
MDAVVIVDPAEYQRRPGEPERPLRTLPFGQAGLVTFLVYGLTISCLSRGSSGLADIRPAALHGKRRAPVGPGFHER